MRLKLKTKSFACSRCPFETNSKTEFKEHIDSQHPRTENDLAVKDYLLEGPNYGTKILS
ncbi:MAG: hypothetical protein IH784_02380 [Bacteroidetes bacterium]|nr:hypothetical protein [Bacteroidota bacterium]